MGNSTSTHSYRTLNPEPPKTTLFKNKPTESTIYRIPSLIYIEETRTFLSFAEKRTSPADVDATFLVMRRGTQQKGSIQVIISLKNINSIKVSFRSINTVTDLLICLFSGKIFRSSQPLLWTDIAP